MSRPLFSIRRRYLVTLFCVLLSSPTAGIAQTEDAKEADHAHEHPHEEHDITEEIVVTGSPLVHDRDELAIPIDRIDRGELLENLGSTLGETISNVPGVTTSGFASGASRPIVRGQDAYRTEVLEDGLGTQDVSRESPDHAVPVNPLAARRIEIVRGPATLRYGGGASAGAVNVITNRIPDALPDEPIQGEVFGGIGLVANERDLAAMLDGGHGPIAWHLDGLFRRSNDYNIPNDGSPSVQSGTKVESFSGSAGAAYVHDLGRLGFSYTRAESDYGIPEEGESVDIEMHTDRFRFEGDLEEPTAGIRAIRLRGVYSDYEHDEVADGDVGQTYRNEEFEGRLEMLHEPLFGMTGAVGLHGKTRDFRGEGEAAEFLAPTETRSAALYLFEEAQIADPVTLEAGFRAEWTQVEGRDRNGVKRDRNFAPLSGSLGLVIDPLDWLTIGLTGTVSQRAPSQVELLARGAHEATQTFELGDSQLDEETSYTGGFRVEARAERGRIEVSGFLTQYNDYIYAELTGVEVDEDGNAPPADPDEALDQLFYRARDARFYGGEIVGELDLFQLDVGTIGFDGRFDWVRAQFTSSRGGDVPRIVPIRWGGGLFFENDALKARVGVLRTEPQQQTGRFERSTAGFTYLNASVAYRYDVTPTIPLDFTIVARNLTDVRGRNHVAFNKEEVLLPGRSIRFGLRVRF